MERWDNRSDSHTQDVLVDDFLNEIVEVFKKHGMAINHEDTHGAFVVEALDDTAIEWIMAAHIGRTIKH